MQATRVLLVDDSYDYYTLINRMLNATGADYKVDWASNYNDALKIILRDEHDIYLVDYYLGQHNGIELMRNAMSQGVTAPMIMITGRDAKIDLQSLQAGAADYIDKANLTIDNLTRAVRYALERAQYTNALRNSEERYRSLVAEAFEGILITDIDGAITFANNKVGEMLGYTSEAIQTMNIHDIIITLADKKDFPPPKGGSLMEHQLRREDGDILDVEVSAKHVTGDHLQFIFRDITKRKAAIQQRDRYIEQLTILHQVDDELSQILNIDYVLTLALDATTRLSGANTGFIGLLEDNQLKVAQAIGRYIDIAGEFLPNIPHIQRLMDQGMGRLITDVKDEPEYIAINPDTRAQMILPLLSYERVIGILNLETNRPERFTEETFDFLKLITARVGVAVENAQLYQISQDQLAELQELYTQVSNLERLKTDMIRMASHDLRNPVGVIMGYTELLRRVLAKDADKPREYVENIDRAARRMKKITSDILSLERIEKLSMESGVDVDLASVMMDMFNEFKDQAAAKSQAFQLEKGGDSFYVQGDSAQLREAMANIMGNAIKYTQDGGTITVYLIKDRENVVFKVVDNGYGIPIGQQESLFKPFFRAYSVETADIEGTGLGLHLIKNIIERHNGSLIFESVYGDGSTFGFRLPVVVRAHIKDEAKQQTDGL